ncbi:MAG TPA: peptidylprolyl isomerase [Phycisphaerae bacterium]|nr:peptidylprolyl isomerase [Phycisphaerae bacterium]
MLRFRSGLVLLVAVLCLCGGCPLGEVVTAGPARVRITTSLGEFLIELYEDEAPLTAQNFLQYVDAGFYDGTIFHRVIPNFVVQGGGYLPGLEEKEVGAPIANESGNGLKNLRGTIAMARTDDPASATSQFFVNLVDNSDLDATATAAGYAVFGRVIEGMEVVDLIAAVPTETRGDFDDVPVTDVVLLTARSEPGADVLTPAWQDYLENVDYGVLSALRNVLVEVLGRLISG